VVWETNLSGYLAKFYHDPNNEPIEKPKVMLANPPVDPMLPKSYPRLLLGLLIWLKTEVVLLWGFFDAMSSPKSRTSSIYSNPRLRKRNAPGFNWYYLHANGAQYCLDYSGRFMPKAMF